MPEDRISHTELDQIITREIEDYYAAHPPLAWYHLERRPDGTTVLKTYPDEKGQAQSIYRRDPDGMVTVQLGPAHDQVYQQSLVPDLYCGQYIDHTRHRRVRAMAKAILKKALDIQGQDAFLEDLPYHTHPENPEYDIKHKPMTLWVKQAAQLGGRRDHALVDGQRIPIPPNRLANSLFPKLLCAEILDKSVLEKAAQSFYNNPKNLYRVTPEEYNLIRRHSPRLDPLVGTPILAWARRSDSTVDWTGEPEPHTVYQAVKEQLQLDAPAKEKAFLLLPLTHHSAAKFEPEQIADYIDLAVAANINDRPANSKESQSYKALAVLQVNQETAAIREVSRHPGRDWAWPGWVHIIDRYLREAHCSADSVPGHRSGTVGYELHDVADAYRSLCQAGINWPRSPSWAKYLERSRQWHQDVRSAHNDEIRAAEAVLTWESPLPRQIQPRAGRTATPLTSGAQLQACGDAMHNCLAAYVRRCYEGENIVFAFAEKDGQVKGAAHLYKISGRWVVAQVRSRGSAATPTWISRWADQLAIKANAAATAAAATAQASQTAA